MRQLLLIFILIFSAFAPQVQAGSTPLTIQYHSQIEAGVTGSSTLELAGNSNRVYLLIQNKGSDFILCKFGSVHSGTEGVRILAGGNYEPYMPPTSGVYCKSNSGTQASTFIEGY
jgi:hypothetical protein